MLVGHPPMWCASKISGRNSPAIKTKCLKLYCFFRRTDRRWLRLVLPGDQPRVDRARATLLMNDLQNTKNHDGASRLTGVPVVPVSLATDNTCRAPRIPQAARPIGQSFNRAKIGAALQARQAIGPKR